MSDEDLSGVPAARLLDVLKAITMILSLPRSAADDVEALAIASGQGEEWRLTHAIRDWEANPRLRNLLVAKGNPAEATYVDITLDYLRGLGLRRVDGVHIQPSAAPNTGLQAKWMVERVRGLGLGSMALVVSPYHLPRAYLTVLRELNRDGIRIPLIPVPVSVSPHTPVPETGATAYDLLPGEVKRILTYADADWVATPDDLSRYLHWLWTEHLHPTDA
ncbi:ElyC/SanA/YdcF family protein [Actinoplanes sp. NPDC026623]|uniref:ElyC/SanA/YdcF family protein n=1 Tax=Actinoplanes sp. NPDC026623 TaxID=3155610 RepID=UPI0033D12834